MSGWLEAPLDSGYSGACGWKDSMSHQTHEIHQKWRGSSGDHKDRHYRLSILVRIGLTVVVRRIKRDQRRHYRPIRPHPSPVRRIGPLRPLFLRPIHPRHAARTRSIQETPRVRAITFVIHHCAISTVIPSAGGNPETAPIQHSGHGHGSNPCYRRLSADNIMWTKELTTDEHR